MGLAAAAILFGYGVAMPVVLVGWLAVAALLSASAGMALGRAGGLEHRVFQHSAGIAAGLVLVVLATICLAWVLRLWRSSFFARPAGGFVRHPVPLASLALLAALAAVTLCAGDSGSAAARYAFTTIVLTNAYFFAVLAVLGSVVLLHGAWRSLHRWSVDCPSRAAWCTAVLALAGALGAAMQHLEWHQRPAAALLERIDLTPELTPLSRAQGAADLQQAAPACVERLGP